MYVSVEMWLNILYRLLTDLEKSSILFGQSSSCGIRGSMIFRIKSGRNHIKLVRVLCKDNKIVKIINYTFVILVFIELSILNRLIKPHNFTNVPHLTLSFNIWVWSQSYICSCGSVLKTQLSCFKMLMTIEPDFFQNEIIVESLANVKIYSGRLLWKSC